MAQETPGAQNGAGVAANLPGEPSALVSGESAGGAEPSARSLAFEVAAAARAIGLEVDPGARSMVLGRVSMRFNETPDRLRAYDVRDPTFDPIRALAAPERRSPLGLTDLQRAGPPRFADPSQLAVSYSTTVGAAGAQGLEFAVTPSANLVVDRDVSGAGAGAQLRLGRNVLGGRDSAKPGGWYVFAGADTQALTWRLEPGLGVAEAVRLEEKTIVGDAQIGVAVQLPAGDLAFGVLHREVRQGGVSHDEQFVGVSFVMRPR